jgi:LPS-assembly protein
LRFYLEQTYDFIEAREEDPAKWKNGKTQEPFSPVSAKLNITPLKYFSLGADAEWSTYGEDLISHNIAASLSDRRGDRLFIEHRFQKDDSDTGTQGLESLYSSILLQMTGRLSATGEYERDLYNQRDLLTSIGILYKAQCWSLQLTYTEEDEEQTYSFMIGLYGLGELESDL